jgi:hypothetical protein
MDNWYGVFSIFNSKNRDSFNVGIPLENPENLKGK